MPLSYIEHMCGFKSRHMAKEGDFIAAPRAQWNRNRRISSEKTGSRVLVLQKPMFELSQVDGIKTRTSFGSHNLLKAFFNARIIEWRDR